MYRRLFLTFAFAAVPAFPQLQEWRFDSSHSAAHFSVRHMMVSNVRGQLGRVTGVLKYDPAAPQTASVEATIETGGIDTRNEKRDAHLRSADFLDVAQHPNITFKSTKVERAGDGKLRVLGDLTIRGTTKAVTLMVEGPTPPLRDARGSRSGRPRQRRSTAGISASPGTARSKPAVLSYPMRSGSRSTPN
ncbi:MAG TPA: YceI family protein [Bryobacteraceae bacterium]|nr:YceI family protein [Bryobacteraceae bacterium]